MQRDGTARSFLEARRNGVPNNLVARMNGVDLEVLATLDKRRPVSATSCPRQLHAAVMTTTNRPSLIVLV